MRIPITMCHGVTSGGEKPLTAERHCVRHIRVQRGG